MARKGLLPDWVQMALVDTSASLPVSGLDERTATSIMFTLEQSMVNGCFYIRRAVCVNCFKTTTWATISA